MGDPHHVVARQAIVVVGPTAPPTTGMTVMTDAVLGSGLGAPVLHVDTADHRGLGGIGRLDYENVRLALAHLVAFARATGNSEVATAYIPVAQNGLGFLRDALFIWIAYLARKRIVVHLHGGYFDVFYRSAGPLARLAIRTTMRRADRGIVLGEALRRCLECVMPVERVVVVPNCVTEEVLLRSLRNREGHADQERVVFLHLSNLQRSKGTMCVAEAFVGLSHSHPQCELILAGPWVDQSDHLIVRELFRAAGVSDRVSITGPLDSAAKVGVLKQADVFVMPTTYVYEGQPVAILEAMACGIPVIATDHAAIAETILPDGGLIVEPNSQSVAAAMATLANDAGLRRRMAAGAAKAYDARYCCDTFSARILDAMDTT